LEQAWRKGKDAKLFAESLCYCLKKLTPGVAQSIGDIEYLSCSSRLSACANNCLREVPDMDQRCKILCISRKGDPDRAKSAEYADKSAEVT